ncbi:CASP-like protein 1F1 [Typha latifolia]|uniref:CASP-like protein 1F1 n=1 Tax=Typha latifolia TaxID=4733 RepID=UPI003C2D22EC
MESSATKDEQSKPPSPHQPTTTSIPSSPTPPSSLQPPPPTMTEKPSSPPPPPLTTTPTMTTATRPLVVLQISPRTTQVLVRSLASFATLAATLIMVLSEDTAVLGSFSMHADYKSSPAFKFFLLGNAIACGYSLFSSFLMWQIGSSCFVHLMDMLAMGLVMAAAASASAIGYVGKYGNSHTGWFQVCNYFDKYCNKVGISFICSYVGFLLFYLVCAMTTLQKPKKNN